MPEKRDKAEDKKEPPPKKPPGYRNFEKVLKQVVKAPPLKKLDQTSESDGKVTP